MDKSDRIEVLAVWKPHPWSFADAAAQLFIGKDSLFRMRQDSLMYEGEWCSLCIPFKEYVNVLPGRTLAKQELGPSELTKMLQRFHSLFIALPSKRYDAVKEISSRLSGICAYPPHSLKDNFDGRAEERRLRAQKLISQGFIIS